MSLLANFTDKGGRARRQVARGRGVLSLFLGDADVRHRLFADRIHDDRVLVACLDGQVVGFMTFQFAGRGPYAPTLADFEACYGGFSGRWRWWLFCILEWRTKGLGFYVYGLKVFPKRRRQGVATALMAAAEAHALTLGAATVSLEVHRSNVPACEFYAGRGFRKVHGVLVSGLPGALFGFALLRKTVFRETTS